jgi:hypothetical protein
VVRKQLFEVFWTENRDLGQEQFALDEGRLGVVKYSPYWDQILELAAGLLHDAILSLQHNSHPGEVVYLSVADNQTVDVETASRQDTRYAGEHTGLILYQTVEDVTLGRSLGRERGFVKDVADSSRRRPRRRAVFGGKRCDATVKGLVSQCLCRGGAGCSLLLAEGAGALPTEQIAQRQHCSPRSHDYQEVSVKAIELLGVKEVHVTQPQKVNENPRPIVGVAVNRQVQPRHANNKRVAPAKA